MLIRQDHGIAPRGLGRVERGVGVAEQGFRGDAMRDYGITSLRAVESNACITIVAPFDRREARSVLISFFDINLLVTIFFACRPIESRKGISPLRSHGTVLESLLSHGS